MEKIMEKFIAI